MSGDEFMLAHTPDPTLPVAPTVERLRVALAAATVDLLQIRDSALETDWPWRDDEADIRYGLYRLIEAIEEAGADVGRILRDTGARRSPAAERIAPATIARWDLHGLLATMDDQTLDLHPAVGEWTARETLGHIVSGQRAYGWFTAWWASRPGDEPAPDTIPAGVVEGAQLPDDDVEGVGSIADIRARLDAILDLSAGRLAYLDDAGLQLPARWAGIPVTVGFRLGRWSSHVIEHTLQMDKGMTQLDRRPSEVHRLIRLIHSAYGRLEALIFPIHAAPLTVADDRGRTVDDALVALGQELSVVAKSARVAAGA